MVLMIIYTFRHYSISTKAKKEAFNDSIVKNICNGHNRPVEPLLINTLKKMRSLGVVVLSSLTAIDLGIGCGIETEYLLNEGHFVIAIDEQSAFLRHLVSKHKILPKRSQLLTLESKFEDIDWAKLPQVDMVLAFYSLTGNLVESFPHMWKSIVNRIKSGGFFVGQLKAAQKNELLQILKDFNIHYIKEEGDKDNHMYSIIAQKNA